MGIVCDRNGCGKPIIHGAKSNCGKCRVASYCDEICQRDAWDVHKRVCLELKSMRDKNRAATRTYQRTHCRYAGCRKDNVKTYCNAKCAALDDASTHINKVQQVIVDNLFAACSPKDMILHIAKEYGPTTTDVLWFAFDELSVDTYPKTPSQGTHFGPWAAAWRRDEKSDFLVYSRSVEGLEARAIYGPQQVIGTLAARVMLALRTSMQTPVPDNTFRILISVRIGAAVTYKTACASVHAYL
jgi:hypothetical protein